jgi:hypothetical protein
MRRYASYGVAVSCDRAEAVAVLPSDAYADYQSTQLLKGLSNRYAVCCHLAMHIMGSLVHRSPKASSGIAYVFELGDTDQSKSDDFIHYVTQFALMRFLYAYRSHGYIKKKDAAMLQSADMFAWEWAKHVERRSEGIARTRGSFKALVNLGDGHVVPADGFQNDNFVMRHVSGEAFERFGMKSSDILSASPEETQSVAKAIFASYYGHEPYVPVSRS